MKKTISEDDIQKYSLKVSELSNQARYGEAQKLNRDLRKKYPQVLRFEYLEAVFTAEQTEGLSQRELDKRYKLATHKLKKVLLKLRGTAKNFKLKVRNEYYWFSKQPYKQYLLGVEGVRKGNKSSYYSQGVGAAMLAKSYALKGKRRLAHRWAKIAERAWKNYFKIVPDWYNSYIFYAMALGFQGRLDDMNQALEKCRLIACRPKTWSAISYHRNNIMKVVNKMNEIK